MLKIDQEGLFASDISGPLNLFTGSGFSRLAHNKKGLQLPTGDDLKDLLVDQFKRPELSTMDLQSVYTILHASKREQLNEYLESALTVSSFDPLYQNLRKLSVSHFYSTNIDDLPYQVFSPIEGEESPIFHDVFLYGEPRDRSASISYIPLHGSVRHENPHYIFTAGQIASAFQGDQQTWFVFQRELQRRPTFFLGYGMKDAGVLQALHNAALSTSNRWILLHEPTEEAIALYESLNFNIMVGGIEEFLKRIASINIEPKQVHGRPRFGAVPRQDEIARRPVRTFFLGAEPEWSDAYSNQVVQRRLTKNVLDKALAGKNVAVVGIPLSGKSTILRQVAVELKDRKPTVFFERLNVDQANELIAATESSDAKPTVIIDQFIDSREAFNKLANAGGFGFIVAESSMFFDAINHRKLKASLETVSCSEISEQDFQSIIDSLPADIKRHQVDSGLAVQESEQRGLFEGLVQHVYERDLKSRFRKRLLDFEKADKEAFDVYIMACYANQCRTLVSYDMIYLFSQPKDYGEAYAIVSRIESFITQVENELDDSQDHFAVRSSALARIAIRLIPKKSFGRVFDKFHLNVSSRVIPDYPTFRRYAFDNDFANRAYSCVKDGLRFYRRLVATHGNAYDYQHGAIYLSKNGEFSLAFEWIDKALSLSGARNFAIRNSHAVILFDANFGVFQEDPSNQTAYDGLRQSMSVLRACIEDDSYRRYHILRFTDQALRISKVIQTSDTIDDLEFSKSKLQAALQDAQRAGSVHSYNLGKYRRLLRDVENELS
ncbi:MAG: SIR2 family protein [Pseudomonadota bacterium]|nr:SIR2 family protein [Pseudomonadota bacterium]